MSVKPSPEEPNIQPEEAPEGEKRDAAAPEDNQPQAGASAGGSEASGEPAGGDAEQPAEAVAEEGGTAEARIDGLEAQVADLTDRLLRAHAEMDNIRKRAEREKGDVAKYAITKFAGDIVLLADNFQRALSAVQTGGDEPNPSLKALVEGVTMMEREFLNVLERYGVKRIEPQGQPFNPHLHDAVMQQENPDVPTGTVVQVFQPGYTIEDRVLRPAMVVVAQGGPKLQPAAQKPAGGPEEQQQAEPGIDAAAESTDEGAAGEGGAEPEER